MLIDFLTSYLAEILFLVLLAALLLYLYKSGRKETVKKIVLSLVVQAEKTLGSGTGVLKYAMVVERLYATLPPLLRLLITQKNLNNMINTSVEYLKNYLSTGDKNLLSYEEEAKLTAASRQSLPSNQ